MLHMTELAGQTIVVIAFHRVTVDKVTTPNPPCPFSAPLRAATLAVLETWPAGGPACAASVATMEHAISKFILQPPVPVVVVEDDAPVAKNKRKRGARGDTEDARVPSERAQKLKDEAAATKKRQREQEEETARKKKANQEARMKKKEENRRAKADAEAAAKATEKRRQLARDELELEERRRAAATAAAAGKANTAQLASSPPPAGGNALLETPPAWESDAEDAKTLPAAAAARFVRNRRSRGPQ